ncbi:MAG: Crp/Fnr family transcriptional regulator [Chloroflexi bacterium]|nr:Crp/Fnr family transcriptional regulator [Chloroflexota bacterium]
MSDGGNRKVWYLRHIDLFASMTDEEVEEIAHLLDDHHIPPGVALLDHRDHDRVYLIKEGAVRLHTGGPEHQVTLALLPPGRMFGLSSTVGDADRTINATTLLPSYICFATWPKMAEVFARYPEVMFQLTRSLAEQVFRTETWLARLGMISPTARLADLLVELSDEFGEPSETGRRIRFRLTQADLARMIGVSRETVSRTMVELGRAGWVARESGRLVVRDRDALKMQANS